MARGGVVGLRPQKVWIVKVTFRLRGNWLPPVVVSIIAGSAHTAVGRGVQEAKKKADVGRRRIHEITANVKPAMRTAEVE